MNVVSSGHEAVTRAALHILERGGNAFDAVAAAGFVSAVAEPALTSLGGGGFLVARMAGGGTFALDFFVDAPGRGRGPGALEPHFYPVTVKFPGADQVFNIGMGSVAVPGCLKGYLHIHSRYGRLPLEEILRLAVRAASEGVVLNRHQAYFLRLLEPIMTATPEGRALFAPNGRYLGEGDLFRNPDLASFLEGLPEGGAESFYSGELARTVAADMDGNDGLLTSQDLASYQVVERDPVRITYRGLEIVTNPYPSLGGGFIAAQLKVLEKYMLERDGWGGEAHMLPLAAVQEALEGIRSSNCGGEWRPLASAMGELVGKRLRGFFKGTTHVSIADSEGNLASMTTSNGEGSGYIVPGTGIMLNNMMGEDDLHPDGFHAAVPGTRVVSMMAPSLVLAGGEPLFVLGSGGSKRIKTAMVQVLVNLVDFGMGPGDAVRSPRIHFDGEILQMEPGIPEPGLAGLSARYRTNIWSALDVYFGGVNLVHCGLGGSADLRRGGLALAS